VTVERPPIPGAMEQLGGTPPGFLQPDRRPRAVGRARA
jgi:hypothetical protein